MKHDESCINKYPACPCNHCKHDHSEPVMCCMEHHVWCSDTDCLDFEPEEMSNFEKIKAMSITELADFLESCGFEEHCVGHNCPPGVSCEVCCEMWLAKEAE